MLGMTDVIKVTNLKNKLNQSHYILNKNKMVSLVSCSLRELFFDKQEYFFNILIIFL